MNKVRGHLTLNKMFIKNWDRVKNLNLQVFLFFLFLSHTYFHPVPTSGYFKHHRHLSPQQFMSAMRRGIMGKLRTNMYKDWFGLTLYFEAIISRRNWSNRKPNTQWSPLSTIRKYQPLVRLCDLEKEPIFKPNYGLSFGFGWRCFDLDYIDYISV